MVSETKAGKEWIRLNEEDLVLNQPNHGERSAVPSSHTQEILAAWRTRYDWSENPFPSAHWGTPIVPYPL